MLLTPTKYQASLSAERRRFEQLFARYKGKVHQVNYRAFCQAQASMEETIQARLDKPTVLVIEDNIDEWFLIRYGLLKQFPGADCVGLSEPNKVMTYLDQHSQGEKELPRLIVLDLYLPDVQHGLHLLQYIKSHPLYQKTPVVVFSRSADPIDVAQSFACLADSYVLKPSTAADWQTIFVEFEAHWQGAAPDQKPITKL